MIWACPIRTLVLIAALTALIASQGCSGFTLGPVVEKKAIIVRAGTAIEIVEQIKVEARILREDGPSDIFQQDVGGWITMHPDHWEALKREMTRLRKKAGEEK